MFTPTLLDRYILKRLFDYFFLGIFVFTLVLFFSDALLDFMKELQHYGITLDIAMTLIGLQLPVIVATVIPMSALLATLMVYSSMNNQFELIAMRMSGISLVRIALPAIMVGLIACGSSYILRDYVVPTCKKYSRTLKTYALNQQNLPATQENFTYKQFDKNQQLQRLIYVSSFEKNRLGYSTVIDLTSPKTLQVVQARSGVWGSEAIHLRGANIYTVSSTKKLSNTTYAGRLELQSFIQPQREIKQYKPSESSFIELLGWIYKKQQELGAHASLGPNVWISLWEKLTIPLSSLPLVLIAVPLAINSPRKLNNLGFLTAIFILFLYYLMRHVAVQLGESQILWPFWAAAMPLVIITAVALFLFRKKNRVL